MKKHVHDVLHNTHLDQHRDGLVRQEFVSFEWKGEYLRKETITRVYYNSGQYTDTSTSETINNG